MNADIDTPLMERPLPRAFEELEAAPRRRAVTLPSISSCANSIAVRWRKRRVARAVQVLLQDLKEPRASAKISTMNSRLGASANAFYGGLSEGILSEGVPPQLEADLGRITYILVQPTGEILTSGAASAAIRDMAASEAGRGELVWRVADQSLLSAVTAEVHSWADFGLSVSVASDACTMRIDCSGEGPRVEASVRYALTTLSGVSDEVPLLLGTISAKIVAEPRQRTLEQRLDLPQVECLTDTQLNRAVAAIAERQVHLIGSSHHAEVRRIRQALVAAALLLLGGVMAAAVVLALSHHT
mmetsp:Transcript_30396/g.101603  ORF Transcript_30396/g.101603 Transcript_30396/m.101603 type:complete len:300 (-) Transcript_30396:138-1037(-)|eukprot:CAMPEP_0185421708 /NCGR_PEP_ID=MMETSP1365-20130426/11213_1 /TAXON_ID=38817 /ORGANISM="Gephyrocapsa oceanica, Strain RCC1303" /LENGTH=299 /DNA_ID=CAMNT_0028025455 /DNA_START=42 /DNA_END=941 /DNA_ORIENTATION=-